MSDVDGPVVRVGCAGENAVVAAGGEFDGDSAHLLLEAVEQAVARGGRHVVVDFRLVTFIESSTVGVLLACRELMRRRGGTLVVARVTGLPVVVLEAAGAYAVLCAPDDSVRLRSAVPERQRPQRLTGNELTLSARAARAVTGSGRLFGRVRFLNDAWRARER